MKTFKKGRACLFVSIMLTIILAVTGCGNSKKAGSEKESKTPKVLRYSICEEPATMDPTATFEILSYALDRQLYNGLTDRTVEGKVAPGLAEKWETNDGGKTYKFTLQKGVKFHSGKELTADDVKYTFETILNPKRESGDGVSFLSGVVGAKEMQDGKATELQGFKKINDYEFEISFVEPDIYFPEYCSVEPLYIIDKSAVEGKGDNWWQTASAGTGPFKLKEYVKGQKIVLEANDSYFRGRPEVDTFEIKIVPEEDTALAMYQNGELDICDISGANVEKAKADEKLSKELKSYPMADMTYLGFNQNLYKPFKDKRVREAFSLIIDREKMANKIMADTAYPLYGTIPVGFTGYNESIEKINYNVERAKQLLAEAGYSDKNPLPALKLYSLPMDKDNAAYIAAQLKNDLGIKVEPVQPDRAKMLEDLHSFKLPFFIFGSTAAYGDARTVLFDVLGTKGTMNFMQYSNKEFDSILEKASKLNDVEKRNELYQKAEKLAISDSAIAPMYTSKMYMLIKPNVEGVRLSGLGTDSFESVKITK